MTAASSLPSKVDSSDPFRLPCSAISPIRNLRAELKYCAQIVLNSTSLHLIPAYSSQSSSFEETLARVGLSESE